MFREDDIVTANITYGHLTFRIHGEFAGTVEGFPYHPFDKAPRYKFKITITNGDVQHSFDYYTSINDFKNRRMTLTEEDLISAFESFVNDAIAGTYSYNDFCTEFGYEPYEENEYGGWRSKAPNMNTKRIHTMCKILFKKARELGLTIDDLYDLSSRMLDRYDQ